jgi:hypothetical protein
MHAFIATADDRPGSGADLLDAVAAAGVNITSVAAVTWGGTGGVAFTADDEAAARGALSGAGASFREVDLAVTSLEHRPGTLAAAARALADAGINIELVLPMGMSDGKVQVGFGVADAAAAERALG